MIKTEGQAFVEVEAAFAGLTPGGRRRAMAWLVDWCEEHKGAVQLPAMLPPEAADVDERHMTGGGIFGGNEVSAVIEHSIAHAPFEKEDLIARDGGLLNGDILPNLEAVEKVMDAVDRVVAAGSTPESDPSFMLRVYAEVNGLDPSSVVLPPVPDREDVASAVEEPGSLEPATKNGIFDAPRIPTAL